MNTNTTIGHDRHVGGGGGVSGGTVVLVAVVLVVGMVVVVVIVKYSRRLRWVNLTSGDTILPRRPRHRRSNKS